MGMYVLLSIMAGWVLLTFVSETIVLAGRDWCVDKRKTPVYYRMFDKYEYEGFCTGFWMVLLVYIGLAVTLTLGFAGASGWVYDLVYGTPPSSVIVAIGMAIWLLSGIACSATLGFVLIVGAIVYPIHVISENPPELVKGVSNWKNQIKDKYCPIVTKDGEVVEQQ